MCRTAIIAISAFLLLVGSSIFFPGVEADEVMESGPIMLGPTPQPITAENEYSVMVPPVATGLTAVVHLACEDEGRIAYVQVGEDTYDAMSGVISAVRLVGAEETTYSRIVLYLPPWSSGVDGVPWAWVTYDAGVEVAAMYAPASVRRPGNGGR